MNCQTYLDCIKVLDNGILNTVIMVKTYFFISIYKYKVRIAYAVTMVTDIRIARVVEFRWVDHLLGSVFFLAYSNYILKTFPYYKQKN